MRKTSPRIHLASIALAAMATWPSLPALASPTVRLVARDAQGRVLVRTKGATRRGRPRVGLPSGTSGSRPPGDEARAIVAERALDLGAAKLGKAETVRADDELVHVLVEVEGEHGTPAASSGLEWRFPREIELALRSSRDRLVLGKLPSPSKAAPPAAPRETAPRPASSDPARAAAETGASARAAAVTAAASAGQVRARPAGTPITDFALAPLGDQFLSDTDLYRRKGEGDKVVFRTGTGASPIRMIWFSGATHRTDNAFVRRMAQGFRNQGMDVEIYSIPKSRSDQVVELFEGGGRAIVVGHSAGASVASGVSARYADHVAGTILVGGGTAAGSRPVLAVRGELDGGTGPVGKAVRVNSKLTSFVPARGDHSLRYRKEGAGSSERDKAIADRLPESQAIADEVAGVVKGFIDSLPR